MKKNNDGDNSPILGKDIPFGKIVDNKIVDIDGVICSIGMVFSK